MALPLPKVVPDIAPGGGIVTAMGAINALNNAMYEAEYNKQKAKFAPYSIGAKAASELAYARLMAPQYIAKMLTDAGIKGNLSDEQLNKMVNLAFNAGTGQGGSNPFTNMPGVSPGNGNNGNPFAQQKRFSMSGYLFDKFKNMIEPKKEPGNALIQPIQPQVQSNPMNSINAPAPQKQSQAGMVDENGRTVGPIMNFNDPRMFEAKQEYLNSEEGTDKIAETGDPNYDPGDEYLRNWYNRQHGFAQTNPIKMTLNTGNKALPTTQNNESYGQNEANYRKLQEEGKEEGKIRSNERKDLDTEYKQSLQVATPLKHLGDIIKNPTFAKARNLPGFQELQLNVKSQIGNEAEQKIIGDFQTTALEVVRQTIMGFGGRILEKEIGLSNQLKLQPKDTIASMLGKYPTIVTFNNMTMQRARKASQLMAKDKSLTLSDALEKADKQVNGDKIRAKVEKELNTPLAEEPITEDDIVATMKARGMTRDQVVQRLKAEGRYNG